MSDHSESADTVEQIGGDLDEYSVGPLDDGTWLVLWEMLSFAVDDAPDHSKEEYRQAKEEFINAHPEDAIGSPEDWPKGMREAWDETVMEEIRDV